MEDHEIRLRCVEAAVAAQRSPNADAGVIVSTAEAFYAFVKSEERKPRGRRGKRDKSDTSGP